MQQNSTVSLSDGRKGIFFVVADLHLVRQSVTAKLPGDLGAERLLALFMWPFYQEW